MGGRGCDARFVFFFIDTHHRASNVVLRVDLWLAFAADASQAPSAELPDGSTFTWPRYENGAATLAQFASDGTIVKSIDASFIDGGCGALESED